MPISKTSFYSFDTASFTFLSSRIFESTVLWSFFFLSIHSDMQLSFPFCFSCDASEPFRFFITSTSVEELVSLWLKTPQSLGEVCSQRLTGAALKKGSSLYLKSSGLSSFSAAVRLSSWMAAMSASEGWKIKECVIYLVAQIDLPPV